MTGSKVSGYLTVYMTMTLAVLLSLCLTMIEGARRSAMRMEAELITDTAMRSIFAEYHRELMRQYNIFAIDSSYGTQVCGIDQTSAHFRDYMEKNYSYDPPASWIGYRDFLGAGPENVSIDSAVYLSDDAGRIFRECAIEAVKDDMGLEAAREVMGWVNSSELIAADSMNVSAEMAEEAGSVSGAADSEMNRRRSERDAQEKDYEEACAAAEEAGTVKPDQPELTELPKEYSSPVSGVAGSVNTGILGLLVEDAENLSRRTLDTGAVFSGRYASGNINTGTPGLMPYEENIADQMLDKALFDEYLMRYMGRYGDVRDEDALWYQIEYLIAGGAVDAENLNSVALRIVGIRAGMNMLYLETDTQKKSEAETLALVICTACMIESMTPVLTHVILLAWALMEARFDTATLLSGGQVPFMKDGTTWHCDLDSALSGSFSHVDNDSSEGLSYKDYLRIFLYMTDTEKLTLRAMDIIEADIRLSSGNSLFRMDACIEMVECSATITSSFGSRVSIKRKMKY